MNAHSAAACQCNSRMAPVSSRMFTPAMSLEMGRSRTVTCLAQPPLETLLWPRENEYLKTFTSPASVGGGLNESGFSAMSDGFFGSGSLGGPPLLCEAVSDGGPCDSCASASGSPLAVI